MCMRDCRILVRGDARVLERAHAGPSSTNVHGLVKRRIAKHSSVVARTCMSVLGPFLSKSSVS